MSGGLRQAAGLSQQALAQRADVSRRMPVSIEKGDVNVSLNTLGRIAAAPGVLFHVLIQLPGRGESARIDQIAWVGLRPGSRATLLASKPARHEVELWSWSLVPGERYDSPPGAAGWQQMLVVIAGRLTLQLSGHELVVDAGDFHVFASDQAHSYVNAGDELLRFVRNVVY